MTIEFDRRSWSIVSSRIRGGVNNIDQATCEKAVTCAWQLRLLGEEIDEYIKKTGKKLRFTLAFIVQKVAELEDIPEDMFVFDFLQKVGAQLAWLEKLDETELQQVRRFTELVGSLSPKACYDSRHKRG